MNHRALEKVARIGCKYEPSFTLYIHWASPSWGLASGQLHCSSVCVGPGPRGLWFSRPFPRTKTPPTFIMLEIRRHWHLQGKLDSPWTSVSPLWILICLNGVHVEAQGLNNHCSDFGYSIANASVEWGRPFHSRTMIWRLTRCVLSVCAVVWFLFPVSWAPSLPLVSFSFMWTFSSTVHILTHRTT